MRFKPVPEPPDTLEELERVRVAVPATPAETTDCCARVIDRTHVSDRAEAASWLTFLRALELATEAQAGFARTSRTVDRGELRTTFRDRVDGVEPILETLESADRPLEARELCPALRGRTDAGRALERTERILEWAVLLGIVGCEADEDAYHPQ